MRFTQFLVLALAPCALSMEVGCDAWPSNAADLTTTASAEVRSSPVGPDAPRRSGLDLTPASVSPARLTLQTDRVIVFKDGHGLFVKTARGTADERGVVYTDEVPDAAVLGSFWATSADGIVAMQADWVDSRVEEQTEDVAVSMIELLRANEGRSVRFQLRPEGAGAVDAVVVAVLERDARLDDVPVDQSGERIVPLEPQGGLCVLLEVSGVRQVVPIEDIARLEGADVATQVVRRRAVVRREKRLRFELGAARAGQEVTLSLLYFRPGIRWIPTYRLDESDGPSVALALQGELLNEAEDIDNARVDLVVGVPNFRFKSVVSPMALETTLRQTLSQAAPDIMGQGNMMMNAMYTQRSAEFKGQSAGSTTAGSDGDLELAGELGAEGQKDLFVYSAGQFSLALGGRATLPLWTSRVPRHDLFTYDIDVVRHASLGYGQAIGYGGVMPADGSPLELARSEVWRQLELENRSGVPWTTGAILLLQDQLPLAQELLTYTPIGSTTLVPVTVAVDVRGRYEEHELSREPDAVRLNDMGYTRIRKRGRVTLQSFRDERVALTVRVRTGGKAASASAGGVVAIEDYRTADWASAASAAANNHSTVTWSVTLDPGESKTLEVDLAYLAR